MEEPTALDVLLARVRVLGSQVGDRLYDLEKSRGRCVKLVRVQERPSAPLVLAADDLGDQLAKGLGRGCHGGGASGQQAAAAETKTW